MERRLMKHGDYVAELRFDKEDGLFHAHVVNLERDSLDFCASSVDELHQEFARSVELRRDLPRARPRAGEAEAALLTTHDLR